MPEYLEIKKLFSDKFASDDFESAFFHTIKHVYELGVKDGEKAAEDARKRITHRLDCLVK